MTSGFWATLAGICGGFAVGNNVATGFDTWGALALTGCLCFLAAAWGTERA